MATTSPRTSMHSTHKTSANASGWSTRRIAVTALFCAVAAICTLLLEFPILPGVTWLKYDPSGIVALIAGFAFGPATGAVVSIIPYLVHLATASGIYGVVMAVLATISLVLPAALVYKHHKSTRGMVTGLVLGGVVCLAACIVGNLIVTPFYTGMALNDVLARVVPALLPFNLIKIVLNCVVFALVFKPACKAMGVDALARGANEA
ncbi:ECF transporter S component [Olsenella sp. Marseille-P4559]|uniref:ECF transporter S component n=1 Tax=Olsenella sp. Marseille-P4559 TaxID=2364795 RepID=UPI001031DA54|nr:ECF transporter S component [Olsenella sp. Marseille-P4559]